MKLILEENQRGTCSINYSDHPFPKDTSIFIIPVQKALIYMYYS